MIAVYNQPFFAVIVAVVVLATAATVVDAVKARRLEDHPKYVGVNKSPGGNGNRGKAIDGEFIVVLKPSLKDAQRTRTEIEDLIKNEGRVDDVFSSAIHGAALSNVKREALQRLVDSDDVLIVEEVRGGAARRC